MVINNHFCTHIIRSHDKSRTVCVMNPADRWAPSLSIDLEHVCAPLHATQSKIAQFLGCLGSPWRDLERQRTCVETKHVKKKRMTITTENGDGDCFCSLLRNEQRPRSEEWTNCEKVLYLPTQLLLLIYTYIH